MAEDVAVRPQCPWEDLAYGQDGLVTVVVQAAGGGRVLMVAHADREAVRRTVAERRAWFFSRSRGRLWRKGETSGHALDVLEVRWDCDADALLYRVRAHGPTCHTGAEGCFYRGESRTESRTESRAEIERTESGGEGRGADEGGGGCPGPGAETPGPRGAGPGLAPAVVDAGGGPAGTRPEGGVGGGPAAGASLGAVLDGLTAIVAARQRERPAGSYVADLLRAGAPRALQKLGEEAVEAVIAGVAATTGGAGRREAAVGEFADLVLHALIALAALGIGPKEVAAELEARHRLRPARAEGAV